MGVSWGKDEEAEGESWAGDKGVEWGLMLVVMRDGGGHHTWVGRAPLATRGARAAAPGACSLSRRGHGRG